MKTVKKYFIQLSTYHGTIVGRIVFYDPQPIESALYTISELNNILKLWQMGELMGSFAIGYKLAENAEMELS